MTTHAELPSISSYTPHCASNYGAHTLRIDLGPLTVWFSFKTRVAFRAPGTPTIIRQNDWGATTGKHLKSINGETSKSDAIQVSGEQYEELWAKYVELHELLDRCYSAGTGRDELMAKKAKAPNSFTGRWRIVSMTAWDEEFIDEEEEGYFEFDQKDSGQFHFGYVHGHMDCRLTTRDGEPAVEWTWDGNDEMDPAQGRGWAVVKGDELHGMIFFHGGDDSEFVAKKKSKPASKLKKPKK